MTRKLLLAIFLATVSFTGAAQAKGPIAERIDSLRARTRGMIYQQDLRMAIGALKFRVSGENLEGARVMGRVLDHLRSTAPQSDGMHIAALTVDRLGASKAAQLADAMATATNDVAKNPGRNAFAQSTAEAAATHLKLVGLVIEEQRSR